NWEFHAVLYAPARRPLVLATVKSLRDRAERYMHVLLSDRAHRSVLCREHRAILEACRRGDPDECIRALAAHLRSGQTRVIEILAGRRCPPPDRPTTARAAVD